MKKWNTSNCAIIARGGTFHITALFFSFTESVQNQESKRKKLEPALGFEPRTYALQVRSSTPELSWLNMR